MTQISEIWPILEKNSEGGGDFGRRIFPESPANLWLISSGHPRRRRLRVGGVGGIGFEDLFMAGGIEVTISEGPNPNLEVVLSDNSFSELFDVLVNDVAKAASKSQTADGVPVAVADRIRKWQMFLKSSRNGLSKEAQRGLYGELKVLAELMKNMDPHSAIAGWIGPKMDSQDFSYEGRNIEVKTTAQKKPVSIEISSERQLDSSTIEQLHLCVLSLDVQVGYGTTLPELVNEIRTQADGAGQRLALEDLLLQAGYSDVHVDKYTSGYTERDFSTYEIRENFPRIVEADCPDGVGNIRYELQLGAIGPYKVEGEKVFGEIGSVHG